MTSRLFFIILFCIFFSILSAFKDVLPIGQMYLKSYTCQFKVDDLLKSDYLFEVASNLSEIEIQEIKNMKRDYCESTIKIN